MEYRMVSKNGLNIIKKYEGFRNHPYLCAAGIPTIGYGNSYYLDGRKVKLTDEPITIKDAEKLLKSILNEFEKGINKVVNVRLNQNQFDAVVSFTYNVGIGAFISSTLLRKININPNDESISHEFKKWNKVNGIVMKGLKKRRNEESYLYQQNN